MLFRSTPRFPVVHLDRWLDGSDRPSVARAVDEALSTVGFFMVDGHGIDPDLVHHTRDTYLSFFHQEPTAKAPVRMPRLGLSGWSPMGMEANGYSFGHETPPDMKEGYRIGAHELPGRLPLRGANVWPEQPRGFRELVVRYLAEVDALHLTLLEVCAAALQLDTDFFAQHARRNDNTLNVNWYPAVASAGAPHPGQYRIGPHTDFGTLTVLHRQPGSSDLEVQLANGEWVHAPVADHAFTINCGDMLALWSGGRWRSAIHRVMAPSTTDPELLSVVYFCEPDPDTTIRPISGDAPAVNAGEYLRSKIDAITMSD